MPSSISSQFPVTMLGSPSSYLPSRENCHHHTSQAFHTATAHQAQNSPLSEGRTVSLLHLWQDPFNIFMGAIWALLFANDVACCVERGVSLQHSLREKSGIESAWRGFFLDGVSLLGVSASILDWAHEEKIIDLGASTKHCKVLGYGATAATYVIRAYRCYEKLLEQYEKLKRVKTKQEWIRLKQKQYLSSLDLAAYSTAAIWAVAGFSSLALGVAAPVAFMNVLISMGSVLAISAIFYRIHLSHLYPKPDPQRC